MPNIILLVDDDISFCESLKLLLRKITEDVHVAFSYKQASDLLNDNFYDIIICDLNLGDVVSDGFSLYRKFEAEGCKKEGLFSQWVFISGDYTKGQDVLGLRNSSFVAKGDDPSVLLNHIQQIMYFRDMLSKESTKSSDSFMDNLEDTFLTHDMYARNIQAIESSLHSEIEKLQGEILGIKDSSASLVSVLEELRASLDTLNTNITPSWSRLGSWLEFIYTRQLFTIGLLLLIGIYFAYFRTF